MVLNNMKLSRSNNQRLIVMYVSTHPFKTIIIEALQTRRSIKASINYDDIFNIDFGYSYVCRIGHTTAY